MAGLLRGRGGGPRRDLPEPQRRRTARRSGPSSRRPGGSTRPTSGGARAALEAWRARARAEPDVDVIASPTLGVAELPPAGVDELEIRLPFSAYTRAFSYLGWPAIAIGDLHLAGRDVADRARAALALERDGGVL